jgi:heme-degrading monooxygenase HmoA
MFVLHVELKAKPGLHIGLEKTFVETFRPAISKQQGFRAGDLLRSEQSGEYRLTIAFDSQTLQQNWLASALHAQVWPEMESHCSAYSVTIELRSKFAGCPTARDFYEMGVQQHTPIGTSTDGVGQSRESF